MTGICGWLKAQIKDEEEANAMYLKEARAPHTEELLPAVFESIAVDEWKHRNLLKAIAERLNCE